MQLAVSQRYSDRQSLLVEPLLPVHWLLLSPNGLGSLKAEALVLDGGFLLSRSEMRYEQTPERFSFH